MKKELKQHSEQISQRPLSMTNSLSEQTFYFSDGTIRYHNTQQNQSMQNIGELRSLTIKNHLCTQEQNKITKVTEVIINQQKFVLKDEYLLLPDQENLGKSKEFCESYNGTNDKFISSRRYSYGEVGMNEKPDTKNLTKNITNIFINWIKDLCKIHSSPQAEAARDNILEKVKLMKHYNKRLLYELAEDPNVSHFFLKFCKQAGQQLIQESKIHDKISHKKALHFYSKIFSKHEQIDPQKKNGKLSNSSTKE